MRDLENVPLQEPQKAELYANLDGYANVVRLCIDGKALMFTTRDYEAVERAEWWDSWCDGEAQ